MKNLFLLLIVLTIGMASCVKQEFDQPPVDGEETGLVATHTIADLLSMHKMDSIELITEEIIVRGVVVADDESGNFYQNFVIQDETGGIVIRIGLSDAWVFYKTGREVFVKCKGLFLGDFAGVTQVGGYTYEEEGRTELGLIVDYNDVLIRGKRQADVTPKVKTIATLGPADISTLITLENVQIVSNEVGLMISDPVGPSTLNRYVEDCFGQEIVLRSSGFADFAADILPGGKGTITGVYSQFLDTRQILIRNVEDIQMNGPRCGTTGPGDAEPVETLFEDFVSTQNQIGIFLDGWTNINKVGSRLWQGGESDDNKVAQGSGFNGVGNPGEEMDAWLITPPILMNQTKYMNFKSATAFYTHDGLSVWISEDYDGVDVEAATWVEITEEVNAANGDDNDFDWVTANEYVITSSAETIHIAFRHIGDGTNTGSSRLDDLDISNESGGGGGGGGNDDPVETLNEDFSSVGNNDDVSLAGWTNTMTLGDRLWRGKEFDGNTYAQATAYDGTSNPGVDMETWMVTPAILMDNDKNFSFKSAVAFYTHNGLTVKMSEDYDGSNVTTATWTDITSEFTLAGSSNDNYDFIDSGVYGFSSGAETVHLAFVYNGGGTETASYIVDDVIVENQ